jgi:hypothetical protein
MPFDPPPARRTLSITSASRGLALSLIHKALRAQGQVRDVRIEEEVVGDRVKITATFSVS